MRPRWWRLKEWRHRYGIEWRHTANDRIDRVRRESQDKANAQVLEAYEKAQEFLSLGLQLHVKSKCDFPHVVLSVVIDQHLLLHQGHLFEQRTKDLIAMLAAREIEQRLRRVEYLVGPGKGAWIDRDGSLEPDGPRW